MLADRGAEGGDEQLGGDGAVRGHGDRVAGGVVEECQDLDAGVVGQAPVGGVGLPGLVRQRGLEADVGGGGRFFGSGATMPVRVRIRLTVAGETVTLWWWRRCQAIVSGP